MLDPGKSWLPEATSLNQALVKCSYCSSTDGVAVSPAGAEGQREWSPGASVLEEPGTWRIRA